MTAAKLGPYVLGPNDAPECGIYTGECAKMMAALPDGCIDLTVTSPPYDNLRDYHGYIFDFEAIAAQLWRVTKKGGVVVWVVGDQTKSGSESGTSFRQALYFMELGFNLHDTMIYQKNSPSYPDDERYYQVFEFMFIFSNEKPIAINLIGDRKNRYRFPWGQQTTRGKDGRRKPKKSYHKGLEYGIRFNIWYFLTGKGMSTKDAIAFEHPAIFPEALARDHIISWSNPGDIVFDPMMGSGTIAKMAKQLGRQWLGFDISAEYVELARNRVANAQPPLFTEETT